MKKNKAHDGSKYSFQQNEPVLIDANIWLLLHPPAADPGSNWTYEYSSVYKRLIASKAKPLTDAIILSEYVNRYFRIEYNAGWSRAYRTFKEFRNSPNFKGLAQLAVEEVREIVEKAEIQNTPFATMDMEAILAETESGRMDFNDTLIVESCRQNGWKLLTNDGDCRLGGIEVITRLPALMKDCTSA